MKAVVESHDPVIEAGQLLLTTRAHTQLEDIDRLRRLRGAVEASEEGVVLEKGAVKLIKAALLQRGVNVHIPLAPMVEFGARLDLCGLAEGYRPLEEDETPEQRLRGLSWLHLVTSVPLMMWQSRVRECYEGTIRTISIALALLAEEGRNWEPFLERHGLTMWNLDLVLRMHQTQAILAFDGGDLSHEEKEEYLRAFIDNVTYVSKREPSNPMNAIAFTAISCDEFICKLLRIVVGEADERGDQQISSLARWHLCHNILLGAEGRFFRVATILKHVRGAHTQMDYAAMWGADSPLTPAKEPKTYWPCLGFAARCRAAIKADPSYAQSMVDAFESDEVLDLEKRHVMCAHCEQLCDKLQKCSACQRVRYCSRNCQVMHWKAGHKQACSEQQAPAHREQ